MLDPLSIVSVFLFLTSLLTVLVSNVLMSGFNLDWLELDNNDNEKKEKKTKKSEKKTSFLAFSKMNAIMNFRSQKIVADKYQLVKLVEDGLILTNSIKIRSTDRVSSVLNHLLLLKTGFSSFEGKHFCNLSHKLVEKEGKKLVVPRTKVEKNEKTFDFLASLLRVSKGNIKRMLFDKTITKEEIAFPKDPYHVARDVMNILLFRSFKAYSQSKVSKGEMKRIDEEKNYKNVSINIDT